MKRLSYLASPRLGLTSPGPPKLRSLMRACCAVHEHAPQSRIKRQGAAAVGPPPSLYIYIYIYIYIYLSPSFPHLLTHMLLRRAGRQP